MHVETFGYVGIGVNPQLVKHYLLNRNKPVEQLVHSVDITEQVAQFGSQIAQILII